MPDRLTSILSAFGGLNTEDSLLNAVDAFQQGDYRYARNTRIGSSTEDFTGAVENFPSTLLVNNYSYWDYNAVAWVVGSAPAGTNIAKGYLSDKHIGVVIWAVYNSNGNHQILAYYKATRTIYEVLKWSGLNFSATAFISICRVNSYYVLTDGINHPRIICYGNSVITQNTFDLKARLGSNFSEYHISFAKWAPLAPPSVWSSFTGTQNDYLTKGIFQFSYRYIFYGGFKSTWAPPSAFVSAQSAPIPITQFNLEIPGFTFDYETPASTGFINSNVKFYQVVQTIEFGYRQLARDSWKLFKRYDVAKSPVPEQPAYFTNNGPSAVIAQQDIGQYFDTVPLLSGACESIDNRVMFGDNLDDLAMPDFSVDTIEIYSIKPTFTNSDNWFAPAASFGGLSGGEQLILEVQNNCRRYSFKEKGIYKLGVIFQHWAGRISLACTQDNWTYLIPDSGADNNGGTEYLHALGFKIPSSVKPPDWAVAYQIVRTNVLNFDYFVEGYVNDFVFLQNDANSLTDWITTPDSITKILNDLANGLGTFGGTVLKNLDINKLANDPNFDLASFTSQFDIQDLSLAQRITAAIRKNKTVAASANAGFIYMSIPNWYLTSPAPGGTSDNPSNNLFYNFQQGDRVIFFGSRSAAYNNSDLVKFDEEIVQFTGQGIIVKKPIDLITLQTRAQELTNQRVNSFLIQIYRPKKFSKDEEVIFYETGEWYGITQPTTSSRDFSKRDFTWTDCASVTVGYFGGGAAANRYYTKMPVFLGDVHAVYKTFYYTPQGIHTGSVAGHVIQMNQDKDNAAGNALEGWEHNNGRPFVAYKYAPVQLQKSTQVRFGGKFLEDSIFISINNFRNENQYIYPSEYGTIRRLVNTSNAQVESVGNILIALGEQEAWSIYVNRTTLEDLSGRSQVSLSDKVLGSYNTLLGSQGTLNPESAHAHNGKLIWWNAKKGVWNRYSRDGITEISRIKMKNWFKDLSDLLINTYSTGTPAKVISVYDNYHDTWMVRFDHSSLPSTFREYASYKCVDFAERPADKRWKEFWDYAPDLFAALDNEVYSIVGSTVQIHEEGVDFQKIYGSSVPSQFEPVLTDNPRFAKQPVAVALLATDGWSFERIRGDFKSNAATIQETRIPLTSLEKREDAYWAEVKMDKNSPNAGSQQAGVVNGNPIKTRSLRLLMQLDPAVTYLSVLYWLSVEYEMSPRNPKN